jgi:hypothetical protein
MRTRHIMVTGSSFGVGKTTIAAALCHRLAAFDVPSRWLSEGELLQMDALTHFERDGRTAHLLDFANALVNEVNVRGDTVITDALLPGYFWLFGRYPPEFVEAYSADLGRILLPLRPMIVYLQGDVASVLERAAAQRGSAWPDKIVNAVKKWTLPYYPKGPVQHHDDLVGFFAWLDRQSLTLLEHWQGDVVILDASTTSSADLIQALLYRLGVPADRSAKNPD